MQEFMSATQKRCTVCSVPKRTGAGWVGRHYKGNWRPGNPESLIGIFTRITQLVEIGGRQVLLFSLIETSGSQSGAKLHLEYPPLIPQEWERPATWLVCVCAGHVQGRTLGPLDPMMRNDQLYPRYNKCAIRSDSHLLVVHNSVTVNADYLFSLFHTTLQYLNRLSDIRLVFPSGAVSMTPVRIVS